MTEHTEHTEHTVEHTETEKLDPDTFDVEETETETLPDDAGEPGEDEGIDGGIPHVDTGGAAGEHPDDKRDDDDGE